MASERSPLHRCELVLTSRCNFKCPYCRRTGGEDLELEKAEAAVRLWVAQGLQNIRFSGGEPTLYPHLRKLVALSRDLGIERIALSTNGSAYWSLYKGLILDGANDFSISLDACCAEDCERMTGGVKGAFGKVTSNIERIAKLVYTTVGVVLTDDNVGRINEIIRFAASLGVADIRIIPAAQYDDRLKGVQVDEDLLERFPILRYRVNNIQRGVPVRGINIYGPRFCGLVLDDMAVCGGKHYPCIIYLREGGSPIGEVGAGMREERAEWMIAHHPYLDPICRANCLDVCVQYNRKWEEKTNAHVESAARGDVPKASSR